MLIICSPSSCSLTKEFIAKGARLIMKVKCCINLVHAASIEAWLDALILMLCSAICSRLPLCCHKFQTAHNFDSTAFFRLSFSCIHFLVLKKGVFDCIMLAGLATVCAQLNITAFPPALCRIQAEICSHAARQGCLWKIIYSSP